MCWALLQQKSRASSMLTSARMPQTVIADFVQPLWQHVLQEAAEEFVPVQARAAPAVGGAVLVPDDDARLIDGKDAALGYGDAKHVAREVSEHCLRVVAPRLAIDNPWFLPCRLGHGETRPPLAQ